MKDETRTRAHELGCELVGFTTAAPPPHAVAFKKWLADGFHGELGYLSRRADERCDLTLALPGAKSVIVVGLNYFSDAQSPVLKPADAVSSAAAPRIARYAQGTRDYHEILGEKLDALAAFIRQTGAAAKWYVDTGPVLERDLAQRAGLGFIGKHTNLISRTLGNWFFLGVILTDRELPPDPPAQPHCGTCQRCLDACPTRAIVAPYQLDARRCISYLTIELKGPIPVELRPLIGDHIFGCDDCLEACPWNRFARASLVREFQRRPLPPLVEFLSWDDAKFREFFHATPILRLKRPRFLRNVCVALGNITAPSALPALTRACEDPDALIREHAAWAVERIQQRMGE